MSNLEKNPNFLKQKYNLHTSPEVVSASKRTKKITGESVSQKPDVQIQNYLDRFKEIIERSDPEEKEIGMNALKKILGKKFIIKKENVPESYFLNQQRIAREQGHGDIEISNEQKEQLIEVIIADQKSSLNNWIDYLSSPDAMYPDWLKYYTFRNITQLGKYNKETKEFVKRTKNTTEPFPDINREALAYVLDAVLKKYSPGKDNESILKSQKLKIEQDENLSKEEKDARIQEQENFYKFLQGENFAKLYAFAIDKVTPASKEKLTNISGKWIKYNKNSDHMPLVESLQGHGTGWCTAGESTAQAQLQGGDFYVYYSYNEKNEAKIPRLAIRMQDNTISEVRGIASNQNIDSDISPVLDEKLKEFGSEGQKYQKRSDDMKYLTEIEHKINNNEKLEEKELRFLYEMDNQIEGFGYQKDPRIEELREKRDIKKDLSILFNCQPNQIATNKEDLQNNNNIKVYIGPLYKELIDNTNIEYIYTKFPGKEIRKIDIIVGNDTQNQIKEKLNEGEKITDYDNPDQITVTNDAQKLLDHEDFKISKEKKELKLIKLSVADLGFPNGATWKEIIAKGKELGLELCPPEVGLLLRLHYRKIVEKRYTNNIYIAMNPIVVDQNSESKIFLFTFDDSINKYCFSLDWPFLSGFSPDPFVGADDFLFLRK